MCFVEGLGGVFVLWGPSPGPKSGDLYNLVKCPEILNPVPGRGFRA
jgi:hypothetical protein